MKNYIDIVLRKAKGPISLDKIYMKVEQLLQKENPTMETLTEEQKREITSIMEEGSQTCDYIQTPAGNYASIMKTSFRKGKFYTRGQQEGRVVVYSSYVDKEGNTVTNQEKYDIGHDEIHSALDGDLVLIDTAKGRMQGPSVEKVLNRDLSHILGEVYRIGSSYFVKPVDKKKAGITIALEGEAIEGQRVDVSLEQQTGDNFYLGTVTRAFGHKNDPKEDILWIAFQCGIDDQFSEESVEQANALPTSITDMDRVGRMDLTDWEIFTIDGESAKDLDDAVSCKVLDNGNYYIGVHIADVSHYVPKGSPLDRDASKKGTSSYLANTVIPMLLHKLSNGICSLNPNVDRLSLSCVMEVTPEMEVVHDYFWESVIHSNLKMTYEDVNSILKEGDVPFEYEKHTDTLNRLRNLTMKLRRKRIAQGALEFNRPELEAIINEDGVVTGFTSRKQDIGENLIEELMLLANETAAKRLYSIGAPCLNRIHDVPNEERLTEYFNLLNIVGFPYSKNTVNQCCSNPKAFQDLIAHVNETGSLSNMLSTNLVRCMSRAKYSTENIGHSGLAKEYYCHFTSPIRRYPDLTVHRLLKAFCLHPEDGAKNLSHWQSELPQIAEHSSMMEKAADLAETKTLAMKSAEYMHAHINEDFVGTVIGINEGGLQVQLENYLEGRVGLRYLSGNYIYDGETRSFLSLDGKEDYYMGDLLDLKVRDANKEMGTIDFKVNRKLEDSHLAKFDDDHSYKKVMAKNKQMEKRYYQASKN